MGPGTSTRGRTHRDRPRVGPDQLGQGARKDRGPQAVQLEGGVGLGQGAEPSRCVRHQGVRTELALEVYRLLLEVVGQAGYWSRVRRGRPAGPAGETGPGPDDLHLRGRDQRDPARHHRHDRVGHAARATSSKDGASPARSHTSEIGTARRARYPWMKCSNASPTGHGRVLTIAQEEARLLNPHASSAPSTSSSG